MVAEFLNWLQQHPELTIWTSVLSVVGMFIMLVAVFLGVIMMPTDYLHQLAMNNQQGGDTLIHKKRSLSLRILRMLLGGLLVILGVAMLVLPGQGVLTILIGLVLLGVPGNRRAKQKLTALLRRPGVTHKLNRLRRVFGRQPLKEPAA